MSEAKIRRELNRTGVYVLVGPPEESGLPRAYVGEEILSDHDLNSMHQKKRLLDELCCFYEQG